jgi:hypothetical protein
MSDTEDQQLAIIEEPAQELVDTSTGELYTAITPYAGASELVITPEEQDKMLAPFADEDVQMRDFDGLAFLPQVFFRERLNQTFGVGQWILKPINASVAPDNKNVFYHGQLYVRGHFVAEAIGEMKYSANNAKQSYASCYEGAKSDCITRCCKDLGIAANLWKPQWVAGWKERRAGGGKKQGNTEIDWGNTNPAEIVTRIAEIKHGSEANNWVRKHTKDFETLPESWQELVKLAVTIQREIVKQTEKGA